MKKLAKLAVAPVAAALMAISAPAAAVDNSLTFQGVTFETTAVDSDTMVFSILNATAATGDWAGVNYLKAFEIKNIGNVTGASITPSNLTPVDLNLNANACGGPAGSQGMCFQAGTPLSLTNSMSWTIDFVGTGLNMLGVSADINGVVGPHVKVDFWQSLTQVNATGSLLSTNITPAIPEPETYAMLLAGLGLMSFVARRRRAS